MSQIDWSKIPPLLEEHVPINAQVMALVEIAEQLNRLNNKLDNLVQYNTAFETNFIPIEGTISVEKP